MVTLLHLKVHFLSMVTFLHLKVHFLGVVICLHLQVHILGMVTFLHLTVQFLGMVSFLNSHLKALHHLMYKNFAFLFCCNHFALILDSPCHLATPYIVCTNIPNILNPNIANTSGPLHQRQKNHFLALF